MPVPPNPEYTDSKGRTTADRIRAVAQRRSGELTEQELADTQDLLEGVLFAVALRNFTIDDFDAVDDLPAACLDVVRSRNFRLEREG